MTKRYSLIALGTAVFLGLVAVFAANTFLTSNQQRTEAALAKAEMTKVAVAAVPLDYGVEIKPEMIRFVDYPTGSLPQGSFRELNQLLPAGQKRVALRPMEVNEPVLASKLMGEGLGASLAALLPDGKRATTVRVNDVSGVAGFIQPHDTVDVLITREGSAAGGSGQITDVLLQNVRVIAMDQNAKDANGKPNIARTATLQVEPIEAQKLALAQQIGSLSLVLRKPGEEQNSPLVQTVSLNHLRYQLYGDARYAAAPVAAARPAVSAARAPARPKVRRETPAVAPVAPRPVSNKVEVIRGTEGSNYEVGGYGS